MPFGIPELIIATLVFAIVFGGNWLLAGWAIRGSNKRVVAGALTAWIVTTIIGMIVFLAFVSIRKRRARAAAAAAAA